MKNFNVKNLINACQTYLNTIEIYKIDDSAIIGYDPEEDTELIFKGAFRDIPEELRTTEVQDFSIDYKTIFIYV